MSIEVENWPYNFPASEDFPSKDQRGNVYGRLLVHDTYDFIHSVHRNITHIFNKYSAYLLGTSVKLIFQQRVLIWD